MAHMPFSMGRGPQSELVNVGRSDAMPTDMRWLAHGSLFWMVPNTFSTRRLRPHTEVVLMTGTTRLRARTWMSLKVAGPQALLLPSVDSCRIRCLALVRRVFRAP